MKFSEIFKISCFLVFLIYSVNVSNAIECYQCNSEYDPRCGDPFDPYSLGKVNCSLKTHLEHLPDNEPVLCRKTTQKIFGKVRVVRDCGYIRTASDDHGCVKKSGTFEVQNFFCSCTNDLCNAASISYNSLFTVIGGVFVISISLIF